MSDAPFLYPNVSSVPRTGLDQTERTRAKDQGAPGEFGKIFEKTLDLNQVKEPLKFSAHASQRLKDRNIKLDSQTMARVSDAIDKADAKGIEDTLVITSDAALIVNVKNRTVITALDKNAMSGNVFTNIDGAVIV